jgi:hypothetical protein
MIRVRVENHGSILLVHGKNERSRAWLARTAPEGAQFWGRALVVEPRYLDSVLYAVNAENGGWDD